VLQTSGAHPLGESLTCRFAVRNPSRNDGWFIDDPEDDVGDDQGFVEKAKDAAGNVVDKAAPMAGKAVDAGKELVEKAAGAVGELASKTKDAAGPVAEKAKGKADNLFDKAKGMLTSDEGSAGDDDAAKS